MTTPTGRRAVRPGQAQRFAELLGRPDDDRQARPAEQLRRRRAEVVTTSPLTIDVARSGVAVPAAALDGRYYAAGTEVNIIEEGADNLVLGPVDVAPWVAYTPAIRSNAAAVLVGTGGSGGVLAGAYDRRGSTVQWRAMVKFGSSGASFPAGQFAISLPFPAVYPGFYLNVGQCIIYDASAIGGGFTPRSWDVNRLDGAVDCSVGDRTTNNYVTEAVPWGWTTGDYMVFSGSYEAA